MSDVLPVFNDTTQPLQALSEWWKLHPLLSKVNTYSNRGFISSVYIWFCFKYLLKFAYIYIA